MLKHTAAMIVAGLIVLGATTIAATAQPDGGHALSTRTASDATDDATLNFDGHLPAHTVAEQGSPRI